MWKSAAVVALCAAVAQAQVDCDPSAKCTFNVDYKGSSATIDFRRLCNAGGDYILSDGIGHTYFAQICGFAAKGCLPKDWENQYEYGRVIQSWGGPPTCNTSAPECVEERTGAPVCCSEPCQVIAVRSPTLVILNNNDPTQGVELQYSGETPTGSDPYQCDFNPATGTQYPRVTHMQFFCDPTMDGFARLYEVDQNSTDDCDYTLKFYTDVVCDFAVSGKPQVSGGWIFNIIVFSVFGAYVIAGYGLNYWKKRVIQFPNQGMWKELEALIWDGVRFLGNRCRPYPRVQATKLVDGAGGSGTVASSPAFTSSSASTSRGYQDFGTAGDKTSSSASYTDL
jgi:hypothetical protein